MPETKLRYSGRWHTNASNPGREKGKKKPEDYSPGHSVYEKETHYSYLPHGFLYSHASATITTSHLPACLVQLVDGLRSSSFPGSLINSSKVRSPGGIKESNLVTQDRDVIKSLTTTRKSSSTQCMKSVAARLMQQ
ncbi:MAG: hypothetical protein RIG62_06315 [Cyclobacteriaceae bacterium]